MRGSCPLKAGCNPIVCIVSTENIIRNALTSRKKSDTARARSGACCTKVSSPNSVVLFRTPSCNISRSPEFSVVLIQW